MADKEDQDAGKPKAGDRTPSDAAAPKGPEAKRGRGARRTIVGTVVSDKMQKTIAVREERLVRHPRYGKYLKRSSIFKAHDEERVAKEGDVVEIAFTRPLSKTKSWTLVQVIRRGRGRVVSGEEDREKAAPPAPRRPVASPAGAPSPEGAERPGETSAPATPADLPEGAGSESAT